MNTPTQTWIVVADDPAASALVDAARGLGGEVVAVVAGRRTVADAVAGAGVDRVLWLGEPADGTPVEAYAPEMARIVAEAAPRAVLGAGTDAGRALLGAVAARTGAPVLAGVTALATDDGRTVVDHSVFGGIAERRVAVGAGPAVVALDAGKPVAPGTPVTVEEVTVAPLATARVTGRRPKEHAAVDLAAARTVVGVGRGLKAEQDLALIQQLAEAFGGELACSRPLAEGVNWVDKERYIGISGKNIAPELYVAVGISGQLQHMVGVRKAKVIVAVNSDRAARIFTECDYGIVGDLYDIVPALTSALKAA